MFWQYLMQLLGIIIPATYTRDNQDNGDWPQGDYHCWSDTGYHYHR
jgi:hypothetical protein